VKLLVKLGIKYKGNPMADKNNGNGGLFLVGVLVGSAIGVVAGLLVAAPNPEKKPVEFCKNPPGLCQN
jgi:hypothetical protein